VLLCEQSVTSAGEDGVPGLRIHWRAYYSTESPAKVTAHYTAQYGSKNRTTEKDRFTWRFPATDPEAVLEVCPVTAKGPWNHHDPPPPAARSIIMISSIAR
jgi:hypothetical protein